MLRGDQQHLHQEILHHIEHVMELKGGVLEIFLQLQKQQQECQEQHHTIHLLLQIEQVQLFEVVVFRIVTIHPESVHIQADMVVLIS